MTLREVEYDSSELGKHRRVIRADDVSQKTRHYGTPTIIREFEAESFQVFCQRTCPPGSVPRLLEAWNQKDLGALLAVSENFIYSVLLTEPVRLIVPGRLTGEAAEFYLVDHPWDGDNRVVFTAD
jgi:hypothetical protein